MTSPSPIRIVIADDHTLVRDGLRMLFETEPDIAVVGEAADGSEAVSRTETLAPDVLILDLAMPRIGGLEVLRALADARSLVKTILLTAAIEREETLQALQLGVRGVVLKEAPAPLLFKCVRTVAAGEVWLGRERVADVVQLLRQVAGPPRQSERPASRLTSREFDIISAVIQGASNKVIGTQCGVSEQTVKNHLSNIFDKVGVSTRLELALYVIHHRLLEERGPVDGGVGSRLGS
jgi:DNA-binding NarL/FixJ family response regulator